MSACGVCGGGPLRRILELKVHVGEADWLGRCPACSLVQAERKPTNDELEKHYSAYCYAAEAAWEIPEATRVAVARVAGQLEPYRRSGLCLDVGCGAGAFLRAMSERRWRVEGTELSEVAAQRLERFGYRIHRGAIEDASLTVGTYDVAIMSEVVEHLRDPLAALRNVASALRPGGALYVTTPNFDSLSRRILKGEWRIIGVPEHLYYFSARSLRATLARVGLTPSRLWSDGLNPYALLAGARQAGGGEAARAAHDHGEALREAAVRRPWVRAAKNAANLLLRATSLGDTLKCVAVRETGD